MLPRPGPRRLRPLSRLKGPPQRDLNTGEVKQWPVFGVAFNHLDPTCDNMFAAVSGRKVLFCRCDPDDPPAHITKVILVFEEPDKAEELLTVCFMRATSAGQLLVAAGGRGMRIRILDCTTAAPFTGEGRPPALTGHGGAVRDLRCSPHDTAILLSASEVFTAVDLHNDYVDCVRWSGDTIVSKGEVEVVSRTRLADGGQWSVKFALDSTASLLALGNTVGRTALWNLEASLENLPDTCEVKKDRSTVQHTAISFDGRNLLCCTENGTIWYYDLHRGKERDVSPMVVEA